MVAQWQGKGVMEADKALEKLRAGNARFVGGTAGGEAVRPGVFVDGQKPFAAVIGCADSRVPVELVFDQGIGDLFVVRVAGNVIAPTVLGSVEFAVEQFGVRLLVVLGHSHCGAVKACLQGAGQGGEGLSASLQDVIGRIAPAVAPLLPQAQGTGKEDEQLLNEAIRANVLASVTALRQGSDLLRRLAKEDGLAILGAQYSLESGQVRFFDEGD